MFGRHRQRPMDTREQTLPDGPDRRHNPEYAGKTKVSPEQRDTAERRAPIGRLILFYIAVIAVGALLTYFVPLVRHAWVSSSVVEGGKAFPKLSDKSGLAASWADRGAIERIASVLLITLGALTLVGPGAWVYSFTRRLRYDAALVHSIIFLPVVASGVVVVVKDSVALAFSLAGIVGIVRFRNTLKDPKDTVYIFLALAIGLAAGVQALDIALVLSMVFNFMVLILWKYNFAAK